MLFNSRSLAETQDLAKKFLETLPQHEDGATLIGLSGDLGSGKTTFTQAVAKLLGVREQISSPTFVIEKIYELPVCAGGPAGEKFKHLIHIDAYRLEKGEELAKLGFGEIMTDPQNLILLEWPEKVEEILPKDYHKIKFEFIDEVTRAIDILWLKQSEN